MKAGTHGDALTVRDNMSFAAQNGIGRESWSVDHGRVVSLQGLGKQEHGTRPLYIVQPDCKQTWNSVNPA